MLVALGALLAAVIAGQIQAKELLWGDTHLHTSNSFDAFLNGNHSADPDVAYRYAKGQPVIHPYNRTRVQINTPLDFLVVTDHAEFYGGLRDIYLYGIQDPDPGLIERLFYWYNEREIRNAIDGGTGPIYFADQLPLSEDPYVAAASWTETLTDAIPGGDVSITNAWGRIRETADAHNQPGEFTALLGWEWSSTPGGANLHRVVVTDADGATAGSFLPFASIDSPHPEDLWKWLEETAAATGANFVSIPHNSNLSKGTMFADKTLRGEPLSADYAKARRTWEPILEVTQIKGDSETHPALSPSDEFADFELYPYYLQRDRTAEYIPGKADYARSALREGLRLESELGVNPFQFGMIGSTDSHTGLATAEEPNFWGKMAYDSVPEKKQGAALAVGPTGWTMSASGLAAVWAEDNTREAIVAAFKRREVYATTGPRLRVTFSAAPAEGEAVTMGGNLPPALNASPTFTMSAEKDPKSANLDRIQIVKGWLNAAGSNGEQVYDVVWAGERNIGADGKLPPVGDTVDRSTGTWTDTIGTASLAAEWQDPDFDPNQAAFYYVRVLQIPTPRHALLDAVALGLEEPTEGPSIIQERAYTSPIWYTP
jgi:hypothetical protein